MPETSSELLNNSAKSCEQHDLLDQFYTSLSGPWSKSGRFTYFPRKKHVNKLVGLVEKSTHFFGVPEVLATFSLKGYVPVL